MPTSAQDPQGAKRQRESLLATEAAKGLDEREWLPLWAMGPVLAVGVMLAIIGVCYIATYLRIF